MATLQVKGLDDNLYKALSARAAQDNRSISQEVTTLIQDYLGRPGNSTRKATEDFLALVGSWEDEKSSEEIIEMIREQRKSGQRFHPNVPVKF